MPSSPSWTCRPPSGSGHAALSGEAKPSYTALVVKAVSLALRAHAYANRLPVRRPFWTRVVQLHDVHVTVAVERDTPGYEQVAYGATLRHTDRKDLSEITAELRALARLPPERCPRWRQFRWIVEKLPRPLAMGLLSLPRWFPGMWVAHRGGAAMVSSPGKYGVDAIVGTWPWPLGFSFGVVKERPAVADGEVVARPTMTLTMSFNRHVMGGAPAVRFLRTVCQYLEAAEEYLGGEPLGATGRQTGGPIDCPTHLC